jgi:hypothetical protein
MRTMALSLLVMVGCGVDDPSIAFVSPAPGAAFTRDQLASSGALVADVGVMLEVGGDFARVGLTAGEVALGDADPAGAFAAQLGSVGPVTLTATAYDDAGLALATAAVDISVAQPQLADCHAWLDLYRLDYTEGPANPGVADPITVKVPINGVGYRYSGNTDPRKTLMGDCALIKSLAEAAPIMRSHDITELVDIGIYNYRCIDQSETPPNCTMSQHAYAKAIDIAAWVTSDGTKYSVLDDWELDAASTTCTAETEPGKDEFLHRVICELKAADVWNIVLTPNYNADHRNHFHVDLTKGADTIKRSTAATIFDF